MMKRLALLAFAATFALPVSAQISTKIYAQQLVDDVVARNPGLLVIVMHVSPPNSPDNLIIASNIGRIGKKGDEDDMRVITTEKTNLEVAHGGTRFEVELVLRDTSGGNLGALGLVFPYKAGESKAALEKKAEKIRDALAKRILNVANLMDPYPLDPLATTKTHAQKLVDATAARHPELLSLALHVSPPKGKDNIILASTFGRHGKKADADDLKVIETGQAIASVYGEGKRFGVELPLQDASGKTIGALSVGYAHKAGHNEAALVKKAEQLRDELRKQIPAVENLVELDP